MSAPLLELDGLTVALGTGGVELLSGLSLVLERGERLGLVGESGSGKSLTALAIMGLLPEQMQVSGGLRFKGDDLVQLNRMARVAIRITRSAIFRTF